MKSSLSQMSSVLTDKIVVGPTNYDFFPDQMSDVFRAFYQADFLRISFSFGFVHLRKE
jgi:hypothetical protein